MNYSLPKLLLGLAALATVQAQAAPKTIVISLDGATPRLVEQYLANGDLPTNSGLGLLQSKGFKALRNETVSPSLTAVGHVAIATGSKAAKNNVVANSFHLTASPFNNNISGFGAPIGGYCADCNGGLPGISPMPTAEPIWERLRVVGGKKVITATWPGGDGVDVRVPGLVGSPIIQPAVERTVDYTVPFGAFSALAGVPGSGAQGFSLTATDFGPAPTATVNQLTAAGKVSFSPVLQKLTLLETLRTSGGTNPVSIAALDTSNDGASNYDTLVIFNTELGIQPGPFALPSTGPAYLKASEKQGANFFIEGSANKAGVAYYVSKLEPDLSVVRISRTSANAIPRNAPVIADVDDINNNVGFWAPQPDFRVVERISPGYGPFPDLELEEIYADRVRAFTDYQARIALRAMSRVPDADVVFVYFEQPDGSGHQFLLTDPRQPSDFTNPNSIGAGQDAVKVARYANYLKVAYQTANDAVQRLIDSVGVDASGKPNANIIVTSDHGFDPFHTAVNMNALFASAGLPSTKVRAVTSGPAVNVYISLTNREPNGIVSRAEYVALQQQVVALLQNFADTNPTYTLGAPSVGVFDKIYPRPLPADINDPSFGRGTTEFIGQDSGDVFAILRTGYNFDGTQVPVVIRQGDAVVATPVLSVPNFYGAHGYDPEIENMSSIFFAAGPDIGQGVLAAVNNIDIAPTLAQMCNVETYAAVDGSPLPILLPAFTSCPGAILATNDPGQCSATLAPVLAASGNPAPVTTCTVAGAPISLPYAFPKGTTTVICTAANNLGAATCSFTVTVVDGEAPVTATRPAPNPSGKNVPGGKQTGANPNGFFQLLARDNCDASPAIYVRDSASAFVAGPFSSGALVKITSDSGATPEQKKMGGAVQTHIILNGSALIYAADVDGNTSALVPVQ